jgi:hypothetical protein
MFPKNASFGEIASYVVAAAAAVYLYNALLSNKSGTTADDVYSMLDAIIADDDAA